MGVIGLFVLLLLGILAFVFSTPALPAATNQIIANKIKTEPSELIHGKTGIAKSGDVNIWYESMIETDSIKGSILLIMGHSSSALVWPKHFYQPLLDAGYQVIRYDNRGLGMSDWMENWDSNNPYTLEDMAKDGIAVLDELDIEKAHVIGISMGGMIAQRFAISHSERINSLCSIMSSGYFDDPNVPPLPRSTKATFLKYVLRYGLIQSEENACKLGVAISCMLSGDKDNHVDVASVVNRTLYEMRKRKGSNRKVRDQHTAAIVASGSRLKELGKINVPTLVIHGQSDPLVFFEHAEIYAPLIPNAKTLWIKGLGHDLPEVYADQMSQAILENMNSDSVL